MASRQRIGIGYLKAFIWQIRYGTIKNTGIGLGLAICADIAAIHNARIKLDSEEGKGTLVQIIFPGYKQDTKQLYDDNCIQ